MPGYVIADVTVTDPETYAGYRALTPGSIAAFGGRFLVRGGEHEVIAGGWAPGRLVLLEFDSLARAAAWYDSPAYVEARAIRQSASTGNMVMVDGDGAAKGAGSVYAIVRHGADGAGLALSQAGRVLVSGRAPEIKEVRGPARGSRCSNSMTVRRRRRGAKRRRSGRQGTRRCWSRVLDPSYAGAPTMPRSCSAPMAPSPRPSTSARISSVCSPRRGPGLTASRGAAAKSSGEPGVSRAPIPC